MIRKIEVSLNGDNERSGDSDWDECKDVQAKRDCIRMLKKCKLSEDKKKKLKRIDNELKKEFEESESQYMDSKSSNIRLIIILALLVLILSFVGIYLYNYFFAEDEELIPTQPPATTQSPATTQPTVEPTEDTRESEWAKQLMKESIYMQKAQAERRKEFSRNSERLTSAPESNEPVTTAGTQQ